MREAHNVEIEMGLSGWKGERREEEVRRTEKQNVTALRTQVHQVCDRAAHRRPEICGANREKFEL
eukprot:scaffold215097_cov23-Tisochrysis_lutea.AAC.1